MDHNTPVRRRPTIRDVAAAAGVSRGTVSRVLNGGHWVSPEALAAASSVVAITQYGSTRSINAGAAAAVVMYEWCRRWASPGRPGPTG